MHGFQSFPTKFEELQLGRINSLREYFPNHVLGFADHSAPDSTTATPASVAALLSGATLFERHLTTEVNSSRVDHNSAISIKEFKEWRTTLLEIGHQNSAPNVWNFSEAELKYRSRSKVLVTTSQLEAGTILRTSDVAMRITEDTSGIRMDLKAGLGRKLKASLPANSILSAFRSSESRRVKLNPINREGQNPKHRTEKTALVQAEATTRSHEARRKVLLEKTRCSQAMVPRM